MAETFVEPISRSIRQSRLSRLLLVAVAILAIGWLTIGVAWPASTRLTNGFSAYYTAARLVREGAPPARFYDDDWFRDQTLRFGFGRAPDIYNVNPPPASLILWPLSTLDPIDAKIGWTLLNLAFLALASAVFVWLVLPALTPGGSVAHPLAGALTLIGVFQPVAENLRQGQTYALLLLLEVIFAWAYLTRRDRTAGVVLAGLLTFKSAGLAFPIMLVVQRRWWVGVWTVVAAFVVVAGTALAFGAEAWTTYLSLLTNLGSHREIAVTAYQSIPGFIAHLFRFDARWNPHPLLDLPWLVTPLTVGLILAILGYTVTRTWQTPANSGGPGALALAAWAILDVVLGPASADYHYSLALLPIGLVLIDHDRTGRFDRIWLGVLVAAILAIGAPWPQRLLASSAGFAAFAAYPRMYGALLLWFVTVRELSKKRAVCRRSRSG